MVGLPGNCLPDAELCGNPVRVGTEGSRQVAGSTMRSRTGISAWATSLRRRGSRPTARFYPRPMSRCRTVEGSSRLRAGDVWLDRRQSPRCDHRRGSPVALRGPRQVDLVGHQRAGMYGHRLSSHRCAEPLEQHDLQSPAWTRRASAASVPGHQFDRRYVLRRWRVLARPSRCCRRASSLRVCSALRQARHNTASVLILPFATSYHHFRRAAGQTSSLPHWRHTTTLST